MSTLAERLKLLRSSAHMTGEDFGEIIGVSKAYISQLESGQRGNLDSLKVAQLSRVFNVSVAWIEKGEGEYSPSNNFPASEDESTGALNKKRLTEKSEKVKNYLSSVYVVNQDETISLLRTISSQLAEIIKKLPSRKK